ncbi:MAG: type II toxin-antitoxin system YafQ family toxin [Kineothrix sp.]|nr:type II toxin-antitoxin system YafQ family toxin [Kineothrix sp.]
MNHLDIVWTNQFKKDYKLAMKRHFDIGLLDDIIRKLAGGELTLARTGTHSDLFGK